MIGCRNSMLFSMICAKKRVSNLVLQQGNCPTGGSFKN